MSVNRLSRSQSQVVNLFDYNPADVEMISSSFGLSFSVPTLRKKEKPFSSFGGEGAYFVGRFSVVLLI